MNSQTEYLRNFNQDSQGSVKRRTLSQKKSLDRAFLVKSSFRARDISTFMASRQRPPMPAPRTRPPRGLARNLQALSCRARSTSASKRGTISIEFGAEPEEGDGASVRRKALIERWVARMNALILVKENDAEDAVFGRVVNIVQAPTLSHPDAKRAKGTTLVREGAGDAEGAFTPMMSM